MIFIIDYHKEKKLYGMKIEQRGKQQPIKENLSSSFSDIFHHLRLNSLPDVIYLIHINNPDTNSFFTTLSIIALTLRQHLPRKIVQIAASESTRRTYQLRALSDTRRK